MISNSCLQDWVTLKGDAANGEYIQDFNDILDTNGFKNCDFVVYVSSITPSPGVTLYVETSTAAERPPSSWVQVAVVDRHGVVGGRLMTSDKSPMPLLRYLRWRIVADSPASPWTVCFQIVTNFD